MGIPICGACRRPIEERVVTALGKNFHVEVYFHFHSNTILFPRFHQLFCVIALCVCQMRKAVFGSPPLRKERSGLLRDSLPSVVRKFMLRLQPGYRW